MRVSFDWLKEYVNIELQPKEVASILTKSGLEVASLSQVDEDWLLELDLPPNRPDCLGIIGIAREVASITSKVLRLPPTEVEEKGEKIKISVRIEDPTLCPRYCCRVIYQVKVAPSPFWLKKRLEVCGIRSINNVVDITNFILLEWGQPLHAFDLDLLSQREILVRKSFEGERFITLDREERVLPSGIPVICDGSRPVAIGGIMGGLNSGVREETTNILLECANFNPLVILKASKVLGLRTASSIGFEKGLDPNGVIPALNRASRLLSEITGGKVAKGLIDQYPLPLPPPREISLGISRLNQILGTNLKKEEVKGYLSGLGCKMEEVEEDKLMVSPPSFRKDLKGEIDLVEEVARLYGYERIPVILPHIEPSPQKKTIHQTLEEKVRDILERQGYVEVINYSFISPDWLKDLNLPPGDFLTHTLKLLNPLSGEQSVMRTALIPSLLQTMAKNLSQKNSNLKIFEVGRVYHPKGKGELPLERLMVAALVCGLLYEESWNLPSKEVDFYDLKGCLENLLDGLRISNFNLLKEEIPYLHPSRSCIIKVGAERVGVSGEISPGVLENYKLSMNAFVFEIDLEPFGKYLLREKRRIKSLPKYPSVLRDISLLVDSETEAQEIYNAIWGIKNPLIAEVKLFDLWKGDSLPQGKKSLTYRLRYQNLERTLTDEEVNAVHQEVVFTLVKKLGIEVRS